MHKATTFAFVVLGMLSVACLASLTSCVAIAAPTFLLQWGSVGSGDGQFLGPNGIAVDRFGHVFVADTYNNRIQKFTSNGVFLTQWGIDSAPGGLSTPFGIAVDDDGAVYVANTGNDNVLKFTNDGTFLLQLGKAGDGYGEFRSPESLDVDAAGHLYVLDVALGRVQMFTIDGLYIRLWSAPGEYNHLGADRSGYIYVAVDGQSAPSIIQKFDSTGVLVGTWGSPGTDPGQFHGPSGVASDLLGNIYVADRLNERIQEFTPSGSFLAMWSVLPPPPGSITRPMDVAVDQNGYIYVVDPNTATVQKYGDQPVPATVTTWGRIKAERR